jgi:hypothetical protein
MFAVVSETHLALQHYVSKVVVTQQCFAGSVLALLDVCVLKVVVVVLLSALLVHLCGVAMQLTVSATVKKVYLITVV